MAEQALYRKWRPAAFDEVVGQEHVIRTIRNALASGKAAHAYLFSGPRGTGKTTTARLVAKALNCRNDDPAKRPDNTCPLCLAVNEGRFLDLIEIDAASNTGVDNIRDLRDKINFAPGEGQFKVYIIDEVHMLSMGAFNALLKTLEEPPAHAVFILATTELHKVPLTVASRCQKHTFRRVPAAEMVSRLQTIVDNEKLKVDPEVLEVLARQATGSLRDAISLLDQLVASPDEEVTLESALGVLGTAGGAAVHDLVEALIDRDPAAGLTVINDSIDNGADPRQFARQLIDYLRGLLLIRLGNPSLVDAFAGSETRKAMQAQAARLDAAGLVRAIKAFTKAADGRSGWLAQLPLEMAFVESTRVESSEEAVEAPPAAKRAAPPPAPKAAAPKATPTTATDSVSLAQISGRWRDVAAAARRKHVTLQALINSCQPHAIEGDVLVLGFKSKLVLEKVDGANNRQLIEEAIAEVVGARLKIRCVIGDGEQDDVPDVASDGVVAEAMKLGGRVRKNK